MVGRRENKRGALDENSRKMVRINAEICMRLEKVRHRGKKNRTIEIRISRIYYRFIRNVSE